MVFSTKPLGTYDVTKTAVQNQVPSKLLSIPDKTVEVEKPHGRNLDRSKSRSRRNSSNRSTDSKREPKKANAEPRKSKREEQSDLRDSATDDKL